PVGPVREIRERETEPRGVAALRGEDRAPKGRAVTEEEGPRFEGIDDARLVLVMGKGGVGKTTCAAAQAIVAARRHPKKRVLVLSTDPAPSLGDAFDAKLGDDPRTVRGAPKNLRALEVDATERFRVERDRLRDAI